MQQYADIYSLQTYSTYFGCHSTHHQEYQKLYPQPPVQVILWNARMNYFYRYSPPTWSGLESRVQIRPRRRGVAVQVVHPCISQYDLYRRLRVQFLILLVIGTVTPETCRVVLQWINICILLHLLDFLFTFNYDARNHELKKILQYRSLKSQAMFTHVLYLLLFPRSPFQHFEENKLKTWPCYSVLTWHDVTSASHSRFYHYVDDVMWY